MPAAEPYLIQSRNTDFYVVSTRDDKIKQQVDTKDGKDSIPPNAVRAHFLVVLTSYWSCLGQVLRVNPPLRGSVIPNVVITGASGLHIALEVSLHITSLLLLNINWISPKRVLPRKPNLRGPTRNTSGSSERLGLARRPTSKSLRGLNTVLGLMVLLALLLLTALTFIGLMSLELELAIM